ncbi:MAG: GTP 3',8-cyclase MoaA, partial [Rhodospirillaceae bacterium]|nr:GTP 3',8-cyclase MoaA [Rhodospirillaceae bacterium]
GERVDQYLPLSEVRQQLARKWTLSDSELNTGGPSRYVDVAETGQKLGFITPLSHTFCETCNRVRMTCTGTLYMCLGQNDQTDLRTPLRASEGDELLDAAIDEAIGRKPKSHEFVIEPGEDGPAVARHMSTTGG